MKNKKAQVDPERTQSKSAGASAARMAATRGRTPAFHIYDVFIFRKLLPVIVYYNISKW